MLKLLFVVLAYALLLFSLEEFDMDNGRKIFLKAYIVLTELLKEIASILQVCFTPFFAFLSCCNMGLPHAFGPTKRIPSI